MHISVWDNTCKACRPIVQEYAEKVLKSASPPSGLSKREQKEIEFAFRHVFICLDLGCCDLWQELGQRSEKKENAATRHIHTLLNRWDDQIPSIPITAAITNNNKLWAQRLRSKTCIEWCTIFIEACAAMRDNQNIKLDNLNNKEEVFWAAVHLMECTEEKCTQFLKEIRTLEQEDPDAPARKLFTELAKHSIYS